MFDRGDRVSTPLGNGTVCYKRLRAPDYTEAEAYSVMLDSTNISKPYEATVFPAEQVKEVQE